MNKVFAVDPMLGQNFWGKVTAAAMGRARSVTVSDQVFQVAGQSRSCGRIEKDDEVMFVMRDQFVQH